jgi:hypothetical protein
MLADNPSAMPQAYLHVDLILEAIIGGPTTAVEQLLNDAEEGKQELLVLQNALFWAVCCVRADDPIDFVRFARLLRSVQVVSSLGPIDWPSLEEVKHWRSVALGQEEPPQMM